MLLHFLWAETLKFFIFIGILSWVLGLSRSRVQALGVEFIAEDVVDDRSHVADVFLESRNVDFDLPALLIYLLGIESLDIPHDGLLFIHRVEFPFDSIFVLLADQLEHLSSVLVEQDLGILDVGLVVGLPESVDDVHYL